MKTFKEITEAKRKPMIVVGTKKEIGHRIADIGPGGKEYNVQTNAAWDKAQKDKMKKGMKEAKDKGEYDYVGDMAMSQLKTICRHAEHFMEMLKPDTNLPEWVQSKITLATDYIQTAHDYMMSEMDEAYSDPYAAKKSAEIKKVHADTMADAKKEYDASKKKKFDKNFMKMKSEDFVTEIIYKQTRNGKLRKERPSVVDAHNAEVAERGRGAKEIETNKKSVKEEVHLDEVITKKTPTGEVISDFVHSKNPTFAGKSKKERIRMALGAKYGMMKKEDTEMATEEFKKGDTVYPKVGPHAGHPHKVIHSLENGTHNIQPIGLSAKRTKYRLGAANAKSHELSVTKEEVELTELKNKTLRSYRFKAKIAAPTTRAPGRERAGEILKKRKDAYLAKKATKAFSSKDRLDARTKDVHPYGTDD